MAKRKIIVDIVDVSNWVHRAYFSGGELKTSTGIPTGAIKVFSGMLSRLIDENYKANKKKGVFIACCMDIHTKDTFRYTLQKEWVKKHKTRARLVGLYGKAGDKDPQYKGNRNKDPKKQEDLRIQMEYIEKLLIASGIPTFKQAPYEADDMIGSIAYQLTDGFARIQSRDKDFAQLVKDGKVILYIPEQANSPAKTIDEAGCMQEFGVKPKQIIHYLQLIGDKVDNIPGVPGVGAKTAQVLLNEFGTLGGIQRNKDKIKGKGRDRRLLRGEEKGLPPFGLTYKLVKIKTDIEVPNTVNDYRIGEPNKEFKKLCEKLEIKSIFGM